MGNIGATGIHQFAVWRESQSRIDAALRRLELPEEDHLLCATRMTLAFGGAGLSGAKFVLRWLGKRHGPVAADEHLFAGSPSRPGHVDGLPKCKVVRMDVTDVSDITGPAVAVAPFAIVHFAAETSFGRSIWRAGDFVRIDRSGALAHLKAARALVARCQVDDRSGCQVSHASTDEVYGSIDADEPSFSGSRLYRPQIQQVVSKAASDPPVRAHSHSYWLSTKAINCKSDLRLLSLPDELIPLATSLTPYGKRILRYGNRTNVRGCLCYETFCVSIRAVLLQDRLGEVCGVWLGNERTSSAERETICAVRDEWPSRSVGHLAELRKSVMDRSGRGPRYTVNQTETDIRLNWRLEEGFEEGIVRRVDWYLGSVDCVEVVRDASHRSSLAEQFDGIHDGGRH